MVFSSILLTGHEYVYLIISVFASRQNYLTIMGNTWTEEKLAGME
jgi:hypothetical protein